MEKKTKSTTKKQTKKVVKKSIKKETKSNSKKKKGFTLIELLAVIIILGILMIIAIPSVTKYISDSRKSSYVDTAKEIVAGTRNKVNEGKLGMYATNTTYYIPASCIETENGTKSPYGEFTKAYVGVIYSGTGYKYYWISVDDAGQGVRNITPLDKLDIDDIESDLKDSDIEGVVTTTGIGERSEIKILNCETNNWDGQYHLDDTSGNVSEENGGSGSGNGTIPSNIVCIPATTLHTKTCERASNGCGATIGNGNEITYGTLVNGNPKAGDAYDCKVKKNGGYTERFYYLGSSGVNSILIYYKNSNDQLTYAYDSNNSNRYGPRTGYEFLPSTNEWNNERLLSSEIRHIVTHEGSSSTNGGEIAEFVYTDKAARFLTYQEVQEACNLTNVTTQGVLDNCNWLFEELNGYENNTISNGYWLETPQKANSMAFIIYGTFRMVSGTYTNVNDSYGVRPVITIKTSDLGQ